MRVAYDKLIPSLKQLLPAQALGILGRAVDFIRRLREVDASVFVWAVVLSRFGHGPGFEQARQWYRRLSGKLLAPRPFHLRFKTPAALMFFRCAFEQAVRSWRDSRARMPVHSLARHFPDVILWDTTSMQVADCLQSVFKGVRSSKAAIKAALAVSLYGLVPVFADIVAGNEQDMSLFPPLELFRRQTLFLFDKGFVAYHRLKELTDAGLQYLCPMRWDGNPVILRAHRAPAQVRKALRRNPAGVPLRQLLPKTKHLRKAWDLDVRLIPWGQVPDSARRHWITARLVITPGPERKQRPYLTNLSRQTWRPSVLRELYRLRWQIELVFKELKQHLSLECLPTKDPTAVLVFAWASLIALALSRTVATTLCPARNLLGLAAPLRPGVLTRALRANVRTLGRALVAPVREAIRHLRDFVEDLLDEARRLQIRRADSLTRLTQLISDGAAA